MIQNDGDLEKCKRASTFERHPFIEWVFHEQMPTGKKPRTRSVSCL